MKVIIAGLRTLKQSEAIPLIQAAITESGWTNQITEIVHGGCRGVDSAAHELCSPLWPVKVFLADWDAHGKAAGPIRNQQMAEYADALIAIWDGKSRGTGNMIKEATKRKLKLYIKGYNWT